MMFNALIKNKNVVFYSYISYISFFRSLILKPTVTSLKKINI